jgi:hypothetical protein
MFDEEIIHVLMLKESATQKPTKFHAPHCRRAGSTFVSLVWRQHSTTEYTDRLKVMVEEHKLGCGKVWLALNSKFAAPVSDLGTLGLLHTGTTRGRSIVV